MTIDAFHCITATPDHSLLSLLATSAASRNLRSWSNANQGLAVLFKAEVGAGLQIVNSAEGQLAHCLTVRKLGASIYELQTHLSKSLSAATEVPGCSKGWRPSQTPTYRARGPRLHYCCSLLPLAASASLESASRCHSPKMPTWGLLGRRWLRRH